MTTTFNESSYLSRNCGLTSVLGPVVSNLTSFYTTSYQSNEASMVSASIIMFMLAGIFFTNNLFSGITDVSAILNPNIRLILSSALSLLLPVMSYLYSEAKNAGAMICQHSTLRYSSSTASYSRTNGENNQANFSHRAWLILVWMLLVELLRKKVDEIRWQGYSGTIQWAGRVIWLGSLVFFDVSGVGRKAVFAILWTICATKLVQRIVFTEVWKRSYAHGKNARLITSYMAQMFGADRHMGVGSDVEHAVQLQCGDDLLKSCSYILMGEEKLVKEITPDGYELHEITGSTITVGKVWELSERDQLFTTFDRDHRLKQLCLSFALFKLLRRRLEHLVTVTKEESCSCRNLLFKGLYCSSSDGMKGSEALFQVMSDEVNFLSEYYHSVVPVVLASPFFFLVNYFLVPVVVLGICLMAIIVSGNGNVSFAFHSFQADNYGIQYYYSSTRMVCLLLKAVATSPQVLLAMLDLSTTAILFIVCFYEEVWELLVFLLSNWFMVSLLCNYAAKSRWRGSLSIRWSFRCILLLRSKMNHGNLCFKQFSVLNLRWPLIFERPAMLSMMVQTVPVPSKVKRSTMEYLAAHVHDAVPLSNGGSALEKNNQLSHPLSWACESKSVAEVILTWHIATSLLEAKCPPKGRSKGSSKVATSLSKYCAYLVAFHPELLPDNPKKTEQVFEDMKEELKGKLGCWDYYFSRRRTRANKIMATAMASAEWKDHKEVVHNGAKLGNLLEHEATRDGDDNLETAWKLLADVWTELVVYVAPSRDEELVIGHEKVLEEGGEFLTVLWALATHTGITRPDKQTGTG